MFDNYAAGCYSHASAAARLSECTLQEFPPNLPPPWRRGRDLRCPDRPATEWLPGRLAAHLTENLAMKCQGNRLSRRTLLTVGAVGGLGLTLPRILELEARGDQKQYGFLDAKAQSIIHIYLPG